MGFYVLWLMVLSPVIATVICAVIFWLEQAAAKSVLRFLGYLIVGAVSGFVLAVIFIVVSMMIRESPQAPLGVILYGPLGIAIGEFIATFSWRQRLRKGRLITS